MAMDWAGDGMVGRAGADADSDLRSLEEVGTSEPALQYGNLGLGASLISTAAVLLLAVIAMHSPKEPWLLEYYSNQRLEGAPATSFRRFADFDTSRNDLPSGLPDREEFSIRLHGCLDLAVTGEYVFYARADDGIRLFIDKTLAIDAWQKSNVGGNEKRLHLTAGIHALTIEYVNVRGPGSLKLEVSDPGLPGLRRLEHQTRQATVGGLCEKE